MGYGLEVYFPNGMNEFGGIGCFRGLDKKKARSDWSGLFAGEESSS
jgi:hypothetical protein